jgi:hypothetical protein
LGRAENKMTHCTLIKSERMFCANLLGVKYTKAFGNIYLPTHFIYFALLYFELVGPTPKVEEATPGRIGALANLLWDLMKMAVIYDITLFILSHLVQSKDLVLTRTFPRARRGSVCSWTSVIEYYLYLKEYLLK